MADKTVFITTLYDFDNSGFPEYLIEAAALPFLSGPDIGHPYKRQGEAVSHAPVKVKTSEKNAPTCPQIL